MNVQLLILNLRLLPALVAGLVVAQALGQEAALPKPPGNEDYLKFALREEGDVDRGKALFMDEQRLACSKCHSLDGQGSKAGPDLFAAGDKFGRREIIDSVLSPSATIADSYNTTLLETKSGEGFSGILKQVTDEWIELMGADAHRIRVPTREIKERRISGISLMPEGLQTGLTREEFNDLIEYLVSLKQPESAGMLHRGMPAVIPQLAKPVTLQPLVVEELKFDHPVWFGTLPGCSNEFLVIEHQTKRIWRLERNAKTSGETKSLFADFGPVNPAEGGLMAMASHPKFCANRKYYLFDRIVDRGQIAVLILEREAASDCRRDSGRDSRIILKVPQVTTGHFGGWLDFGPDGFLYASLGDSGPQEDPSGNAQNRRLLLGKMLRIDVDHAGATKAYSVPPDNPFVGQTEMPPEIWAIGFRAPWRFSFDFATGDLWVGDVGQDRYEKVAIVRRGENHGWNVYEAFTPFSNRYRRDGETFVPPVFAYARKFGPSVTGGFVYRANPRSSFQGVYIFGDYESRRIFGMTQENRVLKKVRQIGTASQRIVSFGQDEKGELYVVGYEGMIYKMELEGAVFE
jgi:putative heme-binding domain-containing protein